MAEPGGVLALDLSLTTGWCYGGLNDRDPVSGLWLLPRVQDLGAQFAALDNEVDDALTLFHPSVVLTEAPMYDKLQTSARLLIGLANIVLAAAWRHGVRANEQAAPTIRRAVLGRGSFGDPDPTNPRRRLNGTANAKRAVIAWCHAQGWTQITDHNEADARVTWRYAVDQIRARQRA